MVPGPIKKRLAPGAVERRDIGGVGDHGGLEASRASPSCTAGMNSTSAASAVPLSRLLAFARAEFAGHPPDG